MGLSRRKLRPPHGMQHLMRVSSLRRCRRLLESFADTSPKLARTYRLSGVLVASPKGDEKGSGPMDVEDDQAKGEGSSSSSKKGSGSQARPPPTLTVGRTVLRRKVVVCRSEHVEGPLPILS
jgi:hypothetical protein